MSDVPVVGTLFLRDPFAPKAQIRKFYEEASLLGRKYQSRDISDTENERRLVVNRVVRALRPHWKALREARTVDERRKIYRVVKGYVTGQLVPPSGGTKKPKKRARKPSRSVPKRKVPKRK